MKRFAGIVALAIASLAPAQMPAEATKWTPAGWGGGGLYWSIAFHPTDPQTIYMGGDVIGAYRSRDLGKTWKLINRGIPGYEVLSLAVDPRQPKRVFASTYHGIGVSDDEGDTWRTLPSTVVGKLNLVCQKFRSVHTIAVSPEDSRRLAFAAPDGRVMESPDLGETWKELWKGKDAFGSSVAYHPKDGSLFAATSAGLLRFSRDRREVKTVSPNATFAVTFSRSGQVAVAAMAKQGLARSGDGGRTWKDTAKAVQGDEEALDVVLDPTNPQVIHAIAVAGWGGVALKSTDGGKSWTRLTQGKGDALWNPTDLEATKAGPINLSMPRNLAVSPVNGQHLMFAANWRPYFSTDGGRSWEERSRGADISVITDVQFEGGRTYVTAMDEGLFVSDDSPVGWRQMFPLRWSPEGSGHQWRVHVWENGKQILSMGTPWDGYRPISWKSQDGGATMIGMKSGLPEKPFRNNTVWEVGYPRSLTWHPSNHYTVYLGIDGDPDTDGDGGGVYKSTDGGWNWSRLPNQPKGRRVFNGLAVDPTDANRIFFATTGADGGVYRSQNGGGSWEKVFEGEKWLMNLHVASDGSVWTGGNELWVSRDHGRTFTQTTRLNEGINLVGLASDPANPNRVWFSRIAWDTTTRGGVFETTDGGKSWREITGDLPGRKPMVLRYNPATRELWAAGPGLFRLKR